MIFQIVNAKRLQTAKNMLARLVPDLCPILSTVFAHVTHRDNRDDRILSLGSHGWVKPRRGVDIKTGVGGQVEIPDDALEIVAVIVCEEEHVRRKLRVGFIHSPEETDDRAGE